MRLSYKKLGQFISETNFKNEDLKTTTLLGVNVSKEMMDSKANLVGTDLSKYKKVSKGQFVYGPVTSRNGDRIAIALCDVEECIVSTSYIVFKINNESELIPEYLMMWFRRPEFDRYARYKSHGSVREIFGWDEMCDVELPVPPIEKQREIVREYHTIVDRIKLNEQLNQKLEETARAIYKQWFEDFEFPISKEYAASIGRPDLEGKPYKSSGAPMTWNDSLSKELPEHFMVEKLENICKIKGGKRLPAGSCLISEITSHPYIKVADLSKCKYTILNSKFEFLSNEVHRKISRYTVKKGDLIISIVGTVGLVGIIDDSLNLANLTENCAKITDIKKITTDYLYYFFNSPTGKNEIEMKVVGGVQGKLPLYNISSFNIIIPTDDLLKRFSNFIDKLNLKQTSHLRENVLLENLRRTLLSKMTKTDGI